MIPRSAYERVKIVLGKFAIPLRDELNPETPVTVLRLEVVIADGSDAVFESLFKRIVPVHTLTLLWPSPDIKLIKNTLKSLP